MSNFKSPFGKPKGTTKPSFAMKPGFGKNQGQQQIITPNKNGENGFLNGAQNNGGEGQDEIQTSPPEQAYASQNNSHPMTTPPPGPSQSRITGTKQFSKPMTFKKKRFVMSTPDRPESGIPQQKFNNQSPVNAQNGGNVFGNPGGTYQNYNNLNVPSQEQRGLQQSHSRTSVGSGQNQSLVEAKHLGPQIMKKKVGTAVGYAEWNKSPLPQRYQAENNHNQDQNVNIVGRKPSSMGPNIRPRSRADRIAQQQSQQNSFSANHRNSGEGNDSEDNYDDANEFEQVIDDGQDEVEIIRNAMKREKVRTDKFQQRQINREQIQPSNKNVGGAANPLNLNKNLDGFIKNKGLFLGDNKVASNKQVVRAKELREMLQLSQEEQFKLFELVPQTPNDIYMNKLTKGTIKTQVSSTKEELVDREAGPDDPGKVDKQTQAPNNQQPDELLKLYNEHQQKQQMIGLKYKRNQSEQLYNVNLQKFLDISGPLMQKVIEENEQQYFRENRADAAHRNAVELKQNIKIPQEVLILFSEPQQGKYMQATIEKVSSIHMFESCPQSKCAVAYVIKKPQSGQLINLAIVYSGWDFQLSNILYCTDEITQMCTSGKADVVICGTNLGSFFLYDLMQIEETAIPGVQLNYEQVLEFKKPKIKEYSFEKQQDALHKCQIKYHLMNYSYMTDGLLNYPHDSPIQKMSFINKYDSGISKFGALDVRGIISVWSVGEVNELLFKENDINMSLGCKYKMAPIFSDNLFMYPNVIDLADDSQIQYVEIEFDPLDPQLYFFSTSKGLFKIHKTDDISEPQQMDTIGLNSPTALSICDKGYLLAAFSCGSICLYHKDYSSPLTVWYQKAKSPITQIKWCQLYFDDEENAKGQSPDRKSKKAEDAGADDKANNLLSKSNQGVTHFNARLCEFFAIDQSEDFSIWNLQKYTQKPAHVIQFSEKHNSHDSSRMFRISTTCWDQSFFTAFALKDYSVNLYLMNFKKGSTISKEKLNSENKKSLRVIKTLPTNQMSQVSFLGTINELEEGQINT